MSIFPKRAAVGDVVTLHSNIFPEKKFTSEPCELRTIVIFPNGESSEVSRRFLLPLPEISTSRNELNWKTVANGIAKSLPLLVVAEYLANAKHSGQVLELVEKVQTGRHFYHPFQILDDFDAGKYTLRSELWKNGRCFSSGTNDTDHFYVDRVSIVEANDGKNCDSVTILNEGPESVPTRIVEFLDQDDVKVTNLILPPFSQTEVSLLHPLTFLFTHEDRKSELLSKPNDSYIFPNPSMTFARRYDDLYAIGSGRLNAFKMSGDAANFLKRVSPLLVRSQLSNPENSIAEDLIRCEVLLQSESRSSPSR